MKEEQFLELVDRLEVYSRGHPTAYRLRVGLLAALGYFYLIAVQVFESSQGLLVTSPQRFKKLGWLETR